MVLSVCHSPLQLLGCVRTVKSTTWFDEHLTEDNTEYMRKSISEEYRKMTADKLHPLKDEPWQRHEWTEGEASRHNIIPCYRILLCMRLAAVFIGCNFSLQAVGGWV